MDSSSNTTKYRIKQLAVAVIKSLKSDQMVMIHQHNHYYCVYESEADKDQIIAWSEVLKRPEAVKELLSIAVDQYYY